MVEDKKTNKISDDKFILMGLDDENTKAVSEVMNSKTAKRILDFLGDNKEASEKDIADGLSMKLNTVEYNLQKLIKAGFVTRSTNFFWSSKGKRIVMYKLAHKHVIIGTKKPSMETIKKLLPAFFVGMFVMLVLAMGYIQVSDSSGIVKPSNGGTIVTTGYGDSLPLPNNEDNTFDSYEELRMFLQFRPVTSRGGYGGGTMFFGTDDFAIAESAVTIDGDVGGITRSAPQAGGNAKGTSYSETNIQVEHVDEPDIVKTDGAFMYTVSNNRVVITKAYPAEDMHVVGSIDFTNENSEYDKGYTSRHIQNIFINGDKLVLFLSGYSYEPYNSIRCLGQDYCGGESTSFSELLIYDVSTKSKPVLEHSVKSDGNYVDARMIDDYVYFVSTNYIDYYYPLLPVFFVDSVRMETSLDSLHYFGERDSDYVFSSVSSVNVNDGSFTTETFLVGATSEIYSSINNIYLTSTEYVDYYTYQEMVIRNAVVPLLPSDVARDVEDILDDGSYEYDKMSKIGERVEAYYDSLSNSEQEVFNETLIESIYAYKINTEKERTKTVIHRIAIDDGDISYEASGKVPGHILNQFSMDEYDGNFRIATTTGGNWFWRGGQVNSTNHVYVLDSNLDLVGGVEDLAQGETIHSARFMGERLYLVTFRQVDPLFVIDLSNAHKPEVLGYLKVTGVSDYLHPYDENHIIGIGRDATEDGRVMGMQISLFDVSDVANPKLEDKYVIGERGTSSAVLSDHKAFLFDKEKGLMVIPVSVAGKEYSEYWYGAYVFDVDSNSIDLRGKVTHSENSNNNYYYRNYLTLIQRSLYIEDVLYTVSQSVIKAHDLETLSDISDVTIYKEDVREVEPYYYDDVVVKESRGVEGVAVASEPLVF